MPSDIQPSGLDFGVVIAFVAPGFIALYAISYYAPTVKDWMAAASLKDQAVGVFLFVFLASLAAGLIVSGVRALLVDNLFRFTFLAGKKLSPDWSKVDDKNLPTLVTIRDNHYRYYQFYANTFIALVFLVFCWALACRPTLKWGVWVLLGAGLLMLLWSAGDSLSRYVKAVDQKFKSQE